MTDSKRIPVALTGDQQVDYGCQEAPHERSGAYPRAVGGALPVFVKEARQAEAQKAGRVSEAPVRKT